ncbi:hypothetical protein PG991_001680, partial [Apiospora marii]
HFEFSGLRIERKYVGYKDFTTFVALHDDVFSIRRFGKLHIRCLLTLQDRLVHLESKLDSLDEHYARKSVRAYGRNPTKTVDLGQNPDRTHIHDQLREINNGTMRDDMPERAKLLAQIKATLVEYDVSMNKKIDKMLDELFLKYSSMKTQRTASKNHIDSIRAWFSDNPKAINDEETGFIKQNDDLICFSTAKSPLRIFIERFFFQRFTPNIFKKRLGVQMNARHNISIYDDYKISVLTGFITYSMILSLTITPLWLLQGISSLGMKLAIISISVILCLGCLSFASIGRPLERLTATIG